MPGKRISKPPFLPSEEVKLGTLITNIKEPRLGAYECPWPLGQIEDFSTRPVSNMYAITQPTRATGLAASFSRLFKPLMSGSANNDDTPLRGGKIYTLKTPNDHFDNLRRHDGVRKWLQQRIGKRLDVYLVAGLATVEGSSSSSSLDRDDAYPAQGERICAMRVMKLVFKPFNPKAIASARLEKNGSWEMFSGSKALQTQASEWVEAFSDEEDSSIGGQTCANVGDDGHEGHLVPRVTISLTAHSLCSKASWIYN
ncbi:hypothetical protein BDV26DRAFT_297299 [Aspergillus bertholletiae]|uniref:Uncharacterized protein n=1 Tax=Aspergillus bertholletiae TaxID=1226010 RepID=A0A5N7ATI0_9EURO|nr:hypothetical protein BDV26DRAFT_297299 [Aspergillus bertholletiae]